VNRSSFAARLVAWQQHAGRHHLPWQNTRDVYRIWLSEVMLQQTQVSAALPYYLRFLERFPDVFALARAPADDVMAAWAGLGYYSRARSLHRCARHVVEQFGGVFPGDAAGLVALPGIGRSTAAAIAVFAYGQREAILEGNVKRVLCRVFGIDLDMQKPSTERELVLLAEELLPASGIESYTQGLMDFGATLCTPRKPACARCPFQSECVAYSSARIDLLPRPRVKRVVPVRRAGFLVLRHDGRIYLERRPDSGIWGGLWCLPHSPIIEQAIDQPGMQRFAASLLAPEGASADAQALALNRALSIQPLARLVHGFTHFTLEASVWSLDLQEQHEAPPDGLLVTPKERAVLALPSPITQLFLQLDSADLFESR
jgi:A/G-specific adenine glycosylase